MNRKLYKHVICLLNNNNLYGGIKTNNIKKVLILGIVSVLALSGSGLLTGADDPGPCLVNLPTDPVTMTVYELEAGWPAYFRTVLSGVGSGFDVSNGAYNGWCIDYGTPITSDEPLSVRLYSSLCPPGYLAGEKWNEVNHILNNKIGDRMDIQIAIWAFINLGPDPGPAVTSNAQAMIDAADSSFVPEPGDIVAVICDPPKTCGDLRDERCFQITIIEVEVPDRGCTRTQGYWKNPKKDWPVSSIIIGGVSYTKGEAIDELKTPVKKDMTRAMFYQLVAAKLNVANNADDSCIALNISEADAWMVAHPLGSGVTADSAAWQDPFEGEYLKDRLDDYNNGLLCVPHCED
jgi:hypothetical protein